MKKYFLTFLFMSIACVMHAVDKHWIPDESAYSGNMSVIGIIQIDGVEQSSDMLEVGAFCGEEVRGSQFPQYISQLNRYIFFLTIHGDDPCEITFKLWDHNTGSLVNATTTQTVQYLSQSTVGSVSSPLALNFISSTVTPHWIPDETLYSGNMSVVGVVQIDGVEQASDKLEIGAFYGDEVRGSQFPQYIQPLDRYIFFLTIHGDDPCEITFKLWNHNTGTLSDATTIQTIQYLSQSTVGSVSTPYELNFTTSSVAQYTFSGSGSWTNPSNWTAPGGTTPTLMPDLTNEDVIIDGMAQIQNGTSSIVKSLTINTNKVLEINEGASLKVNGTIDNNNDANSLVLDDGGQIFQTNAGVKATFKKTIVNPTVWGNSKTGWQFISCPINEAPLSGFTTPPTGDYDLYVWDIENGIESPWVNCKAHYQESDEDYPYFFDNFTQGLGYLASYEKQGTASFTGELNHTDEFNYKSSGLINYGSEQWENIFLIGNPFTFDVEWEDFEKGYVTDGFVTLNPNTGSYVYHDGGTIKVGEGFVIQTTKGGKSLKLKYPNSSKNDIQDYKTINVTTSNSKGSDNTIISFNSSENEGFQKLQNFNDNIATIYTIKDNKMYGIANFDEDVKEFPLYFDAKEMGTYTISMKPAGDFSYIHLIDRMTGADIDMLLEGEYKFNALSSDNTNRFIVRLSNEKQTGSQDCFAYQSGNALYVNESGTVQIIDMTGRIVMNETLKGNCVDISGLKGATYIVRLIGENGVKTQKIVVL